MSSLSAQSQQKSLSTTTTTTTTGSSSTSASTQRPGKAGRCDYDEWDKVTRTLVNETEKEEQEQKKESSKALGLDGKYASSDADASERQKAKDVLQAKQLLENYKKRESAVRTDLIGLLGPVPKNEIENEETKTETNQSDSSSSSSSSSSSPKIVRITREQMDAGKRVLAISDTSGRATSLLQQQSSQRRSDTIVLTSDLSLLESKMKTPARPKVYPDDAENDVVTHEEKDEKQNQKQEETTTSEEERKIYGVIKCFFTNIHNCTILIKCKVISGTIEISHCTNVVFQIERDATVATIQVDLSNDVSIIFNDAPSGKNGTTTVAGLPTNSNNRIYWGQDKDDRIFHAGVRNMKVRINRDGYMETEKICDYINDGATVVGNATLEEYQFVTSCDYDTNANANANNGEQQLITEAVLREGSTTGQNARPLTKREFEKEKEKRQKAGQMAINMAENMIQFKEKDGGSNKVTRNKNTNTNNDDSEITTTSSSNKKEIEKEEGEEEIIEEVYASISKDDIDAIVKECERNKARGNEAFGSGEYAQAVLLYTLALDKADELPDNNNNDNDNDSNKSTNTNSGNNCNGNVRSLSLFARDVTLSNRAAAFLKLGQHEKAANDAKLAYEKYNDKNVKAYFRHGLALHAMKKYSDAIPILAIAHKLEPKNKSIMEALRFAEMRFEQELRK